MNLRWVGESELDRVISTRLRCYAKADGEITRFGEMARKDPRPKSGDYLLAEIDGQAVGTATHLTFQMNIRGGVVPCQGVAWVGAIKTMRRKGEGGTPGVASAVMHEVIRRARDSGDVVTALMPFRASYYEHFGYGVVENRVEWTVPMPALPTGSFEGIRFCEPSDFTARSECLARVKLQGQCDISRSDELWRLMDESAVDGMQFIDRVGEGPARSCMLVLQQTVNGKESLIVTGLFYEDAAALRRVLGFLSSLKDQYSAVQITLPTDVPLNWLLRESHISPKPVHHAVAEPRIYNRMQMRILEHAKFLESLHILPEPRGSTTVAVHESEGHKSRFSVTMEAGRIACKPSEATANFECADKVWAAVATGAMKATDAVKWGLATGDAKLLDVLTVGPTPFTLERF